MRPTDQTRSALLEEAERRLRMLSLERLRVASDFLAYLEEKPFARPCNRQSWAKRRR